jgi:hypothetical protein
MPRVALYQDKYIESDAANFINGKTRECRLRDKDIAAALNLKAPTYCKRKRDGRFDMNYLELVKIIKKLQLTDEEIIKLMRGKVRA